MPFRIVLAIAASLVLSAAAAAAPIQMIPGSVTLAALGDGNDFDLIYNGGDTSDDTLYFTVQGHGGDGLLPSAGIAAMVFDTTVVGADDTSDSRFNWHNVINGLYLPDTGVVAAVLVDWARPSSEDFWVQLTSTPSYATIYSLDLELDDLLQGGLEELHDYPVVDSQIVRFVSDDVGGVMPEPSAAIVFGLGLLITRSAVRRRR